MYNDINTKVFFLAQMEDENQDAVLNGIGVCAGNGVIPERRHSSTEGSRSSRGEVRVTVNRRHSLPGAATQSSSSDTSSRTSDGVVIEIHGRDVSPESGEVRNTLHYLH